MISFELEYLKPFKANIQFEKISQVVKERKSFLCRKDCPVFWKALENQPKNYAGFTDYSQEVVSIGDAKEVNANEQKKIQSQLKSFISWRKGPFSVFGNYIDSEWRSGLKWNRIFPHLDSLKDKIICDVGCNNGYYMFRMAHYNPRLVLGIDPVHRYKFTFEYLQNFARAPNLYMELLGFEHLPLFQGFFDTVFLMGIVYHHKNPIEILKNAWQALKDHGQIIVDSMGIPGMESIALFPGKRYAKAPGVWFIPTEKCLLNWIERSGFYQVKCIFNEELQQNEQRRTPWSPHKSLQEFLDKKDPAKTVEGFPRPRRIYIIARKKP